MYFSFSRVACPVFNYFKVSIPVSTQPDEWIAAEVLRDEFTHIQSQLDAVDSTAQLENQAEATVELSARFLAHVATSIAKDPQSTHARTALLLNVLKHFTSAYLATKDIIPLPPPLIPRRVKPSSQHIFMQSPFSTQHLFPLSRHWHSSQPHLQERPPSSPPSVVRAQMRFTLTSSRTSMTFIHLLSRHSCKPLPRTSLFPLPEWKKTPHSILMASM